jgi:DNA-binding response OmpR family regulator
MVRTVLVVDDNKKICDLLDEFLRGEEFEVLCANTGSDALSILRSPKVDVAVVDLLLPGDVSSEQVIERATVVGVPVIIMSGALTSDTRGRDLTHPRLAKPFKMMQLQSAIESILKDKPS